MFRTKKTLLLAILFLFTFSNKMFSLGAGAQIGIIPSVDINENGSDINNFDVNLTGTIKLFRIPAVFGFGLDAGIEESAFIFGASGFFDYWFIDYQINNTWNFYSGAGISAKLLFDTDSNKFLCAGPRFFAGLNWLFYDNYLEYYVQLTAVPQYINNFETASNSLRLSIPVETGARLHF